MNDLMIVIDMQKDFIDGALGTPEAVAIVPHVARRIRGHHGPLIVTYDTHYERYLQSQEGHHLPVIHCQKGSPGWQLDPAVEKGLAGREALRLEKPAFGSLELADKVRAMHEARPLTSITLLGLCTDICVIANALILKAALPEVPLYVDAEGSAGVSPKSHRRALEAMAVCQVNILHG